MIRGVINRTQKATMKIYTKTGDKGTSALYNGERRLKDDATFEALGTTDELSSHLGLAREFILEQKDNLLVSRIEKIQCLLQGSNIATPRSKSTESKLTKTQFDIDNSLCKELETWIDEYQNALPFFIIPSGGKAASSLHIARSVCRRAERRVSPLVAEGGTDSSVGIYLNRLSDFLFAASRHASHFAGIDEVIYRSGSAQKK